MFCCCSTGPPTLTLVFLLLKRSPCVPGSALRYNLSPNQKGRGGRKKAKPTKNPEVVLCSIKPLGNQLNTQKAVFKRKLSAINRVQLSSCVPGQRLLLLLMAIQLFLRKAVQHKFPSCKSVLINSSAMLFFDFVYPVKAYWLLYIAAIQLLQVLQMPVHNVTCKVQIHSSKKMSKQVSAHFQQCLIIDT